jgi:hypothetical protein
MSTIKKKSQFKIFSFNSLFNKINNILNYSDLIEMEVIKKEFYIVNRDVLLPKIIDIIPNDNNIINYNYQYSNSNIGLYNFKSLNKDNVLNMNI